MKRYLFVKKIDGGIGYEYVQSFDSIDDFLFYLRSNLTKNRSNYYIKNHIEQTGDYYVENHILWDIDHKYCQAFIGLVKSELREERIDKLLNK
ncbi:MAG: hypothetical protein SLAVMIC_00045 [uncultured marine phage]|uniref:Uncharacterized protein n=1 Tax=uncultured marine phage TaxID=707152 RepID=A0A8D9FRT3_9VIRU|nr:MAG: hypothetical protein SLAVMIC_00045 [uncultured marine phage]